jgi:hypothetical protein
MLHPRTPRILTQVGHPARSSAHPPLMAAAALAASGTAAQAAPRL